MILHLKYMIQHRKVLLLVLVCHEGFSLYKQLSFSSIHLALTRFTIMQWQAGTRHHLTPSGFEPDKSNWGWNWLERWMAVRPWENRFLDINLKDGVKIRENEQDYLKNASATQFSSTGKRTTLNVANGKVPSHSGNNSNISNEKRAATNSDGCSTSPNKSANVQESHGSLSSTAVPKPAVEGSVEEATSRLKVGSRSQSNPKERSALTDKQGKKRLSLPASGESLSPYYPLAPFD